MGIKHTISRRLKQWSDADFNNSITSITVNEIQIIHHRESP